MDSCELPDGYHDDEIFDNVDLVQEDSLSGYSSDDGGEFQPNLANAPESIRIIQGNDSSSDEDKEMEEYFKQHKVDEWNERFQILVETAYFRKGEENYSAERQYELSISLRQLCMEFAEEASAIGVQIVKQMFLPPEEREIKPITKRVGGVAGGEKYLFKSIFFKFPVDSNNLYGGDFFANKTAEHELKGLMSAFDCRVEGLHVPLTALINYRGYSLIAQSWLPLDSETIVYGTPDGGNTIYSRSKEFAAKMKEVGEQINLKPHDVWNSRKQYKRTLYGPADLEGHIGHDKRCYVLDCSRLFPPCAPDHELKAAFLYRLLRPEFLKRWKVPLSSDAFSKFGKDFCSETHNQEVRDATLALESVEVPSFAKHLDQLRENKDQKKGRGGGVFQEQLSFLEELPQLIVDMHLRGINIRYLLLLLTYIKHNYNKTLVTTEVIARHIKNQVRDQWRSLGKHVDWQDDIPYKQTVCQYFNSIFGSDHKGFWKRVATEIEKQNFPLNGKSSKDALPDNIRDQIDISALFFRLEDLLGLRFSFDLQETEKERNFKFFRCSAPFHESHVHDIVPKIKYINRITFEEGTALSRLAMMNKDDSEAAKLLELACTKYKESLAIRPNDTRALYNWGLSLSLLAATSETNKAQRIYNQAAKKYKEALVINPKDRRALFMWGNMLTEQAKTVRIHDRIPMLQKACQLYNQSLELVLPEQQDFEVLYNCGVSYLTRANALARQKETQQTELHRLLTIACQRFTEAIQIQPSSVNAYHNLAVSTAKRARTLEQAETQHSEYFVSFRLYHTAYQLDPHNSNLLFDWGNALYRYAMSIQFQERETPENNKAQKTFTMLQESFEKYYSALLIDPIFEAAFINLSLVLTSLLSVPSAGEEQKFVFSCSQQFVSVVPVYFSKNKAEKKSKEAAVRALTALYKVYRSFPDISSKLVACFELLEEPIPENRAGSNVKKKKHKLFTADLKSSTNCGISDSPDLPSTESAGITRPRGLSCPSEVPLVGNDSSTPLEDVSLPSSDYNTPRPRKGVLSRIASKLLRRKSKKEILASPPELQKKEPPISCSSVDVKWNNDFLYSTFEELKLSELLVHQQVLLCKDFSVFLVRHLLDSSDMVYYLMVVFEEKNVEIGDSFEILEHPNILRLRAIFRAVEKLYMLFDLAVYPLLPYYRSELTNSVEKREIYVAKLFCAVRHIQDSPVAANSFRLSSDRVFVDRNGSVQVLAMVDWPKSEIGKSEDLQQGLKFSHMLYASPGQLRGERSLDDIWWSFGILVYQMLVGQNPYDSERVESIFKLMNTAFEFTIPPFVDDITKDFLQRLLSVSKESRLAEAEQIRLHPFFASVDWENIYYQSLPIPITNSFIFDVSPGNVQKNQENKGNLMNDETNQSIRLGQPLDTLIAPALKNDWAGFTLRQANVDNSQ